MLPRSWGGVSCTRFNNPLARPDSVEPVHGTGGLLFGGVSEHPGQTGDVSDDETPGGQREGIVVIHDPWPKKSNHGAARPIASATLGPLHATRKTGAHRFVRRRNRRNGRQAHRLKISQQVRAAKRRLINLKLLETLEPR